MNNHHQNPKFFEHDRKQRSQRECIFDAVEAGGEINVEKLDLQDCLFFLQNQSMSSSSGKQPIIDQHHQQQLCPHVVLAKDISTTDSDDLKKRFPESSNSISLDSCDRKRKRENDRAYRERCKANVIQLKHNLAILGEENIQLNKENETLKRENASVNHRMQIQSTELDGLKKEFQKLNLENQKESVLVQVLSDLFVSSPDLQGEYHQLRNENIMLKHNKNADFVRMVEENVKLKYENRVLRANKDALCAKLVTEGDKIDN